jgi:hypothetical protein
MDSFRTKKAHCKKCLKVLDAHSGIETLMPKKGDISICAYCAHICEYDEDLNLRPLNERELNNLKKQKEVWVQITKIRTIIKNRISNN